MDMYACWFIIIFLVNVSTKSGPHYTTIGDSNCTQISFKGYFMDIFQKERGIAS